MKKAILGALILIILLFYLPSCTPETSQGVYDALLRDFEEAQQQIDELTEESALQTNYDNLQAKYEDLVKQQKQAALRNPTWAELKEFLQRDKTDTLSYVKDVFDCGGFSITLRDNAWVEGIRCAYVEISFSAGEGHALNAFNTTDNGVVYVDNTENDQIAYVAINQPYGKIALDGVKPEYIACTGDPTEFWEALSYTTHSNLFSYDYCADYLKRRQFYDESVEAYNKAADEYDKGSTKWSHSQLATWFDNLEALKQDLGSRFYQPADAVRVVEVYWN